MGDSSCCQGLNHGVVAVGYDDADGYWVIRNSWGVGWGEEGYFKLASSSQHAAGACGVLQAASYPLKKTDTNPEVPTFCGYWGLQECTARTTCQCEFSIFGLCWPWSWGCQSQDM